MFFKDCCNNITDKEYLCCKEIPIISTVCYPDHIDIYVSVDCPGLTYTIQKKLNIDPPEEWVALHIVDMQPYTDNALAPNTDYDYRVEVSGVDCVKVYSYEITRRLCEPPCCTKKPNISYEVWYATGNVYVSFLLTEGDCAQYKIYKYGLLGWEFLANITPTTSVIDFIPLAWTDPVTCVNESYMVEGTGTDCLESTSTPVNICYTLCCDPDYTISLSTSSFQGNGIQISIFKLLDTPCYNCIKIYKRVQGDVYWTLFIESDNSVFWFFDYDVVDGVTYEYYAEWSCQNGSLDPGCEGCDCLLVKSDVFSHTYIIPDCCTVLPIINITEFADHLHLEFDNLPCQDYVFYKLYRKIVGDPNYTFLTLIDIPYTYDDYTIAQDITYEYKLEISNNNNSCDPVIVTEQYTTVCTPTVILLGCSSSVKKGNWVVKPNALGINLLITLPSCCVDRNLLISPGSHSPVSQFPSNPLPVGTTAVTVICDVLGGACFQTPGTCPYTLDIDICGETFSYNCYIRVTN